MPRKPRRRPFGSITTVNRGKHVIRWTQDTPQGRKRLSKTLECSYSEACRELSRIQTELGLNDACMTVGQVYDRWYHPSLVRRVEAGSLRRNTLKSYEQMWALNIRDRWSRVPLDQIRRYDVQEWMLSMSASNATISLNVLNNILNMAVKMEVLEANKLKGVTFEKAKAGKGRSKRVYTLAEAEEMLARAQGSPIEAAYILACFGSARTTESLGVMCRELYTVEDSGVEFVAAPIVRLIDDSTGMPTDDGMLKNPQSVRTALIPMRYGRRLMDIAREKSADGVEWLTDRGDGMPMTRKTLLPRWKALSGDMHIPFANLRNSWRTFMQYELGVSGDVLELLMGHKLPGVSGAHYIRPSVQEIAHSLAVDLGKLSQDRIFRDI